MAKAYRFPHPAEYGTRRAVTVQECPGCHERYVELKRPVIICTDLGEPVMTYKPGQLICNWCLQKNCKRFHLRIVLS